MTENTISQTKTIHEYLAENPDVDVTDTHQQLYGILGDLKDRVLAEMPDLTPQPECAGLEYWQNETGYEGSMETWTGQHAEHVAHSFIGNRKASILDMNLQVFLSQETDVPHLVMVFGTIPNVFYYSELVARRDIRVDPEYLEKYYGGNENAEFLKLRGDKRFTWSVSHGTYMRALNSPNAHSYTAELGAEAEIIPVLREAANQRFNTWLGWWKDAMKNPLPESERLELMERDHLLRRYGYELDPMNKISENNLGVERTNELLAVRVGREQIRRAEAGSGIDTLSR
jgi:hypothetical protein